MSGGEDLRVRLPAGTKWPSSPERDAWTSVHDIAAGSRRRGPSSCRGPWSGGCGASTVCVMDIAQLLDLSLTDVDERSVQMMALEPADVSAEAVAGLQSCSPRCRASSS